MSVLAAKVPERARLDFAGIEPIGRRHGPMARGQRIASIARSKAVYSAIELNGPPAEPLACRFFAAVL